MEPRLLLSVDFAPIQIGAVYLEDEAGIGADQSGDLFEITFSGGAPGTQLTQLVIDTDRDGNGYDCFFDIEMADPPSPPGVSGAAGPKIHDRTSGIESIDGVSVVDGGKSLVFTFSGFDPGDRLVFSIDVDEEGWANANPLAEGAEFEGSKLGATFVADHFYDVSGTDVFLNVYDFKLGPSKLVLPSDDYVEEVSLEQPSKEEQTAGAIFSLIQEPLPITIAGTVFEDVDLDNTQDPGDPGLAGVTLTLYEWVDGGYAATDHTATTDTQGDYLFEGVLPGTYRIVETQPAGYFSIGATAGTVGGQTRGVVAGPDAISEVALLGGEDSVENDFAEARPASLSGYVYHDASDDGIMDPGEKGIGGVLIQVQYIPPEGLLPAAISVWTEADGSWSVGGLMPGQYRVVEDQPEGYFDGLDAAGTVGGTAQNPGDMITGVHLLSGQSGEEYNFGELMPASISGRVYVDADADFIYDSGDILLSGVTVHLLNASGSRIQKTTTDENGEYVFAGLKPGTYGVEEIHPTGYVDGPDQVGSEGGSLLAPDSIIDVVLASSVAAVDYDFREFLLSSISGYVYVDDNDNGQFELGEDAIAGAEVVLLDAGGTPTGAKAVTDAAGFYRFDNLMPRTYGLDETQPQGYFDGLDTAGSVGGVAHNPGDRITGAVLKPGVDAVNYNFGELRPASISGRVHAELNGDFQHNPGEPLLAGVTIHLLDASGGRLRTTTTNAAGEYLFSGLEPGTYGVREIQPQGYLDGPDFVGTVDGAPSGRLAGNDRMIEAQLGSGAQGVEYNFCEVVPASISGYVFQDGPTIKVAPFTDAPDPASVRDGRFTPDDTPIAGVVLQLGDGSGAPLQDSAGRPITAVTDANGYYQFTMLEQGSYTVLQVHPEQYVDSVDTAGSRGGSPVNPHAENYRAILQRFDVDLRDDAIVEIWLNMGDVATSYNFSEVLMEDTPLWIPTPRPPSPIPPPPPAPPLPAPPPPVMFFPVPPVSQRIPMFGGSAIGDYTWHLSVINAGRPRGDQVDSQATANQQTRYFDPVTWSGADMGQSQWLITNGDGITIRQLQFGTPGATPVAGDFNGDGIAEVGVYIAGNWFIDLNGNGVWDRDDFWASLGSEEDMPVVGDWDGDGKDDIGIFGAAWIGDARAVAAEPGLPDAANRPTGRYKNVPPDPREAALRQRTMQRTAQSEIRSDLIDHVFRFGTRGDQPIAGDWNGDGAATIGVFRDGTWYLDVDGNGRWSSDDVAARLGQEGDTPVVGDFNNDGVDDLGVYRAGTWYLDSNGNRQLDARDRIFQLGGPNDKPAVGDFNGDGADEIALYRDHAPSPEPASQ